MKQIKIVSIFLVALFAGCLSAACKSGPPALSEPPVTYEPSATHEPPVEKAPAISEPARETAEVVFDPTKVSHDLYESTKKDVQLFINMVNGIIQKKDYEGWKSNLSEALFREISSPKNLQSMSDQPAMKMQKIVLKTPQDYFNYVVVPSRANSTVDEIEFISQNVVKAYTIRTTKENEEVRLRLYELEKTGNTWKIIN
jgi:hypothetical protein